MSAIEPTHNHGIHQRCISGTQLGWRCLNSQLVRNYAGLLSTFILQFALARPTLRVLITRLLLLLPLHLFALSAALTAALQLSASQREVRYTR